MTRSKLLHELKLFCADAVKDMTLPTAVQKGDKTCKEREPDIYKMRLPDSREAKKLAPYIIIQFLNSVDKQEHGKRAESLAVIRFIFCVYDNDEQEGAMMLLNVMDAVRIKLLKEVVIGGQFKLDTNEGLESLVYPVSPDFPDTAPYFGGEMVGNFILPPVEREVNFGI